MNKPDKHKPLSAEELFRLLDETSDKTNNLEDLDDFEKEALEGFMTSSVSTDRAKALTDELNTAILEKASKHTGSKKNNIIWFSAAASIVVVIMISVFFLNKSQQDALSNIALNDVKETEKLNNQGTVMPQLEVTEEISFEKNKEQSLLQKSRPQNADKNQGMQSHVKKTDHLAAVAPAENKPQISLAASGNGLKEGKETKQESDYYSTQPRAIAFSDKGDRKDAEKSNLDKEQVIGDEVLTSKNNVTTTASETVAREEQANQYKVAANKNFSGSGNTKKAKQEDDKAKQGQTDSDNVLAKVSAVPVQVAAEMDSAHAYYEGGEMAIRDFVISYLKEKQISTPIKGKYKVRGSVDATGKFETISIVQLSKEYCGCEDKIKEALNASHKWISTSPEGKKSPSDVEFIIAF